MVSGEIVVNPNEPTLERSPLCSAILAYLAEHPQAQDSLEGIVEWWLLEQHIKQTTTQVNAALEQLVDEGLVIAHEGAAGRVYYRMNRKKLRDIRRLLRRR